MDTREAVLEAAAQVVARRGLRDASIDEIAASAGCSKGAVYWHFKSKDDLFFALLEDRVDRPHYEMIEQDMGPEASRRFVELLRSERDLLLLNDEYWARAMRDPAVRARYADRQARLRAAIGKALVTRLEHLGARTDFQAPEVMATAILAIGAGLARERLIDPDSVPDGLLGSLIVLLYKGLVADAEP
jgi:AcrR family transcriptional regulator